MPEWYTEILAGTRIMQGAAVDLTDTLNRLQAEGWTVVMVLVNGVDRWTIICKREA